MILGKRKQKSDLVNCLNNSFRRLPKRHTYNNYHLIMGFKSFQLFCETLSLIKLRTSSITWRCADVHNSTVYSLWCSQYHLVQPGIDSNPLHSHGAHKGKEWAGDFCLKSRQVSLKSYINQDFRGVKQNKQTPPAATTNKRKARRKARCSWPL